MEIFLTYATRNPFNCLKTCTSDRCFQLMCLDATKIMYLHCIPDAVDELKYSWWLAINSRTVTVSRSIRNCRRVSMKKLMRVQIVVKYLPNTVTIISSILRFYVNACMFILTCLELEFMTYIKPYMSTRYIYIYNGLCTVLVPSRHACGITSQETNKIQRMNSEVKRTIWHHSRITT